MSAAPAPTPADQPVLIVGVESVDPVAAGFHIARASIVLATPSVVEAALDTHAALAASLKTSLLAADQLAASFAAPLTLAGGGSIMSMRRCATKLGHI